MIHPHYRRIRKPGATVKPADYDRFGPGWTCGPHYMIPSAVHWLKTINKIPVSIIRHSRAHYEMCYKIGGEYVNLYGDTQAIWGYLDDIRKGQGDICY